MDEVSLWHPLKNLKWYGLHKAVFHTFLLVHSWILCSIWPRTKEIRSRFNCNHVISAMFFRKRLLRNTLSKLREQILEISPNKIEYLILHFFFSYWKWYWKNIEEVQKSVEIGIINSKKTDFQMVWLSCKKASI